MIVLAHRRGLGRTRLSGQSVIGHDEFVDDVTLTNLPNVLLREGFNPDSYRVYGGLGANERYVLDVGPAGWEVYYCDLRGMKDGLRVFQTEGEACAYFLELLRRDPTTRRQQ